MKLTCTLLALAVSSTSLLAQKPGAPTVTVKKTTAAAGAVRPAGKAGCVTLPSLSPKIPALPSGLPCARPLYTITNVPSVKLDYVSPLENPGLRESLGLEASSFSLAYVDTKIGSGPLAAPHKWYSIHYTGYLTDGTKFDSSLDRGEPINIHYGEHMVIPGWDTGFDGMHVGGKRRLYIPYQLAYGPSAHGSIPPKSELIFDVEFVAQSDTEPAPKAPKTPPAAPAPPASSAPAATPPASQPAPSSATPPPAATPAPTTPPPTPK